MINAWIFLIGVFSTLPVYLIMLWVIKKRHREQLEIMEGMCYEELSTLIDKMNHEGPIPKGSSASGLLNLTLLAMNKTITLLEQYANEKGWNLQIPISDLRGIAMVELTWLKDELDKYLEAKRSILKDYHIEKRHEENRS